MSVVTVCVPSIWVELIAPIDYAQGPVQLTRLLAGVNYRRGATGRVRFTVGSVCFLTGSAL